MNFNQFSQIVNDLREMSEVVQKHSDCIKPKLFNAHNKAVSDLLEAIYTPEAITYILYEWLIGNKSPLTVNVEGAEMQYPLDTMEDLYKVMEMYKAEGVDKGN